MDGGTGSRRTLRSADFLDTERYPQITFTGAKVGTVLATKGPQGETIAMRVHEVKDKTIVVDFNHPLAGKTLKFDVKITDIKAADAR